MLKKLNIIEYVLFAIDAIAVLVVGFIQGFSSWNTYIAVVCGLLLAYPLIYLIMMVVKTSMINDYEEPRFMPLCMILIILLGCLIWYCFFHIAFIFAKTIALWYALALLALTIPYFIYKLLTYITNKKKNNSNDKPKIIKNK